MKTVDEIFYDALCADETLVALVGDRIVSTCFEVPPEDLDNTPLPCIVITFDGFQGQTTTKDTVWEGEEDRVQVGVEVDAASPGEVKQLTRIARRAIENYVVSMYQSGKDTPELESITSDGISWDWMKPCYWQKLYYTCLIKSDIENEQEN